MKAKKAKPIPKQQQTLLVGRDYLSLLIRQLDLEIHVTNMIFRKFINPKVCHLSYSFHLLIFICCVSDQY